MRILGIDYGTKKVGIALNSENLAVASEVLPNDSNLINNLLSIIAREEVAKIIVGWPVSLKGKETKTTQKVEEFITRLDQHLDLPIIKIDERLTTRIVGKNTSNKDKHSAAQILQTYLDQQH